MLIFPYREPATLRQRRVRRNTRRLCIAVLAGLSALMLAQVIAMPQENTPVIVVSTTVERGHVLTADNLVTMYVPRSLISKHMLVSADQAQGTTALITLYANTPIPDSAVSTAPAIPTGYSVVDLPIANASEGLTIASRLTIRAHPHINASTGTSAGPSAELHEGTNEERAHSENTNDENANTRIVSDHAILIGIHVVPHNDHDSPSEPEHAWHVSATLTLAMPADDTVTALSLRDTHWFIASDHHDDRQYDNGRLEDGRQ